MSEKRRITFGDILELVDAAQEGGQVLRIVGPEESFLDGVTCSSNCWILDHLLEYRVLEMNNDQNQNNVLVICLGEKERNHEPEKDS